MSQVKYEYYPAPGPSSPDTAIGIPHGWGGNESNTEARFEDLAKRTGADIHAFRAPGTGRVIIDRATRRSLRSTPGVEELAREQAADFAEKVAGDYGQVLGLGDSGRAHWVARMQLSGRLTGKRPFTRVLTRDGANLHAPESVWQGAQRLLRNAGVRGPKTGEPTAPQQEASFGERLHTAACSVTEMAVYGRLMCGTEETTLALLDLARDSATPFMNVMVGQGISGSVDQAMAFNSRLFARRTEANKAYGELMGAYRMPLHGVTTVMELDWGHGNLLDPAGLVKHIDMIMPLATE
jgi:hypothetical protein